MPHTLNKIHELLYIQKFYNLQHSVKFIWVSPEINLNPLQLCLLSK